MSHCNFIYELRCQFYFSLFILNTQANLIKNIVFIILYHINITHINQNQILILINHINDMKESNPKQRHLIKEIRLPFQLGQKKRHPIQGGVSVCLC